MVLVCYSISSCLCWVDVVRPSSSVWHQTPSGTLITASPKSTRHNSYRSPVAFIVSSVLQNGQWLGDLVYVVVLVFQFCTATQVDCWSQKLMPVVSRITRTADGLCQMVTQGLRFHLFEVCSLVVMRSWSSFSIN